MSIEFGEISDLDFLVSRQPAYCTLKNEGRMKSVSVRPVVQIIWGESFGDWVSMHEA